MRPDVSIVIVNWNSRDFLARCLRSVFGPPSACRLEVVVIDNASYDGSRELVEAEFPQVRFIQGARNLGFARANNAAASRAGGRNLLFLNPDTEVSQGSIDRMVQFIDESPDAGAVGCRLLNTDGSLQTSCVQAFPTVANQLLDSELLRRWFPGSALWGTRAFGEDPTVAAQVQGLSGACMLVEREAFEAAGRFTESYFMYAEDVDLCFKLQRAGRRNYYLGDATVVHHGGQSSGAGSGSQFGNVLMRESIAMFLRDRRGRGHAWLYRGALALSALVRLSALGLVGVWTLGRYQPQAVRNGWRKWKSILRWTIGAEPWVRNPGAGA